MISTDYEDDNASTRYLSKIYNMNGNNEIGNLCFSFLFKCKLSSEKSSEGNHCRVQRRGLCYIVIEWISLHYDV